MQGKEQLRADKQVASNCGNNMTGGLLLLSLLVHQPVARAAIGCFHVNGKASWRLDGCSYYAGNAKHARTPIVGLTSNAEAASNLPPSIPSRCSLCILVVGKPETRTTTNSGVSLHLEKLVYY